MCDRVNVMYAGTLVETGTAEQLFSRPRHPYTLGLLQSIPRLDAGAHRKLQPIEGQPRNMLSQLTSCPFAPRCRYEVEQSRLELPRLTEIEPGHAVACFNPVPGRRVEANAARRGSGVSHNGHPLVELDELRVWFPIKSGIVLDRHIGDVKAVDGVTLSIRRGETIGLVGESGCGKSTVGRAILRLNEPTTGRISFDGRDITGLSQGELRPLRARMQMIFQDPFASLNPRHSVGRLVGEPMKVHGTLTKHERTVRVRELLEVVGLPRDAINRYPHEFSGGQRQRIGLARALSLNPEFVVCDEPVSALDVSIQAQIINLLEQLQDEFGLTYLFIAHDLAVVRHISDRIAVMYLGKVVEISPADDLYDNPLHPYTIALLSAIPIPDPVVERTRETIGSTETSPSPANPPAACRFHTRCPFVQETRCRDDEPLLRELEGHQVALSLGGGHQGWTHRTEGPQARVRAGPSAGRAGAATHIGSFG